MSINWTTVALQLINFAILVWVLQRFLYRPVLRMVDARRTAVEKQYSDAALLETQAKERLTSIESQRLSISTERTQVLRAACGEADRALAARRLQAEQQAAVLLEEARKTIALERQEALETARRSALELGISIARRLVQELPEALRAQAWLERIEAHLAALAPSDWNTLVRDLGTAKQLRVVTATQLVPEAKDFWRARLARSPIDAARIAFETDPLLIAGAALHFGDTILSFSFESTVKVLRAELEGHADAA